MTLHELYDEKVALGSFDTVEVRYDDKQIYKYTAIEPEVIRIRLDGDKGTGDAIRSG